MKTTMRRGGLASVRHTVKKQTNCVVRAQRSRARRNVFSKDLPHPAQSGTPSWQKCSLPSMAFFPRNVTSIVTHLASTGNQETYLVHSEINQKNG
jgi:hypothetical protein